MDKLDLILEKLGTLEVGQERLEEGQVKLWEGQSSLEIGLSDTNQIVKAIRDHQDETNAKLEAISMDVHYLIGQCEAITTQLNHFQSETAINFRRIEGYGMRDYGCSP